MVKVMLFEDNKSSKLITALSKLYEGTDVIVTGSSSAGYLSTYAIDLLNDGANAIYMYKDFVANNNNSVSEYKSMCRLIVNRGLQDKIALIPIPCAEYYSLKAYEEISKNSIIILNDTISYETQMKDIVKTIPCFWRKRSKGCRFWQDNCTDENHLSVSLEDKYKMILMQLPIFIAGINDYRIHKVSLANRLKFANSICLNLADIVKADVNYCREVLNMNPLLNLE